MLLEILIDKFGALVTQNTEYSGSMKGVKLLTSSYIVYKLEHFLGHSESCLVLNRNEEGYQHDLVFMLDSQTRCQKVALSIQGWITPISCIQMQSMETIGGTGKMLNDGTMFLHTHGTVWELRHVSTPLVLLPYFCVRD